MNIYRNVTFVAVAGLVLLGTVGCATGINTRPTNDAASGSVAATAVDAAPQSSIRLSCDASALPQPTWTPPIVSAVAVECPTDIVNGVPGQEAAASTLATSHVGTMIAYSLSGLANQETLQPAEAMTEAGILSGHYHPATAIQLIVYPDPGAIDTGVSGPGITVSKVRLDNGFTALVTQGSNGYGTIRIAWTDNVRSYLLMTTVMKTDSGPSGANLADMVRMAGSTPAS
ncbi:MAG TPA: hypothetical protein VN619_04475 [Lacisediminihabitans sp.]|jgi:hypothetical protein|nr:hypothetical protein [Lacisediminihabitans sp.]HXD61164.1 hypothetical protein [Lacisediminihabitans sp.]